MGCKTTRQKYINKLNVVSNGKVTNRDIEEILVNTYCKLQKIIN